MTKHDDDERSTRSSTSDSDKTWQQTRFEQSYPNASVDDDDDERSGTRRRRGAQKRRQ